MKKFLFLILMFSALAIADLSAKVCMVNTAPQWLNNFKTSGDTTPMNSSANYGWGDTWSVLYEGNLIEGIAMCVDGAGPTAPPPSQNFGKNCWCRMIKPVLGSSWVFSYTYSTPADCSSHCALNCAYCVRHGTNFSCSRAALLAS